MADAFGTLAAVGLDEAYVREREAHHQDVHHLPDPDDDGFGLAVVDLHRAGGPEQLTS